MTARPVLLNVFSELRLFEGDRASDLGPLANCHGVIRIARSDWGTVSLIVTRDGREHELAEDAAVALFGRPAMAEIRRLVNLAEEEP